MHTVLPQTRFATFVGFAALVMWSSLAALSVAVKDIPPFQLLSIGMFLGGLSGAATWPFRPGAWRRALVLPPKIWAVGIYGLFFYHLCFFLAFRWAPPLQANIINYLWPLFTIIFSVFLPGHVFKSHHLTGLIVGVLGVVTALLTAPTSIDGTFIYGYLCAGVCALTWSSYTVMSRYYKQISTDAVTGFCFAVAFLSFVAHLCLEQTLWPTTPASWLSLLLIGLFPTGIAFYAWDYGVKKGNLLLLGFVSYATRIASSVFLWIFGFAEFNSGAWTGIALITAGAAIASRELFVRRRA